MDETNRLSGPLSYRPPERPTAFATSWPLEAIMQAFGLETFTLGGMPTQQAQHVSGVISETMAERYANVNLETPQKVGLL
jgi:hypothetical protein